MILRKPYAFFIRHFKFIHFILTLLMGYVALKMTGIISFFNEYLQSTASVIGPEVAIELYPVILYVILIVAFIIETIVFLVMKIKKKAILFYVINIIFLIYTFIVMIYSNQIVRSLELGLVEIRTLKLVQDLLVISFSLSSVCILITAIRALGFDLKKFEFGKDVDLQIDEKDREEFELDVSIDTDTFKRKLKRNFRYFKYVYKENKTMIILTVLIIVGCISAYLYWNVGIYNKMNKEGTVVSTNDFLFGVTDSYVTKKDYKGNEINNYSFVVVKIKVKNKSEKKYQLQTGRIGLVLDKMTYYPTTEYQTKFYDLGNYYIADEISNTQFKNYILVYEVPTNLLKQRTKYLRYSDSTNNQVKYKLSLTDIDGDTKQTVLTKEKQTTFNNRYLKGSKISIKNVEINDVFKVNYRFCFSDNECSTAYEYIRALLDTNYDKSLIKVEGNYDFNTKLDFTNASRLGELLANYGNLEYTLNGQKKNVVLKEIKPTKITPTSSAYLEVPSEVKQASKIDLVIKIRNYYYVYHVK